MSVFNFSTKENTKENYNELLYESSVLNFNCVEECIFPNSIKLIASKKVCIDILKFAMIQIHNLGICIKEYIDFEIVSK